MGKWLGLTLLIGVGLPLFLGGLWLRFWGLPDQAKVRLLKEMEKRGISMEVEALLLDPTGGVLAEKVTIFQDTGKKNIWAQVDRIRMGIAWLSWWQGRPFLERATVRNAEIRLPIGEGETVDLQQVDAAVEFGVDFLNVRSVEAYLLNFHIFLQGRIHLDGLPPPRPPTLEQEKQRAKLWRQVKKWVAEVGSNKPLAIQGHFDFATSAPERGKAEVVLHAESLEWHGVFFPEWNFHLSLEDQVVGVEEFRLLLERGEIQAAGEVFLDKKQGELDWRSDADVARLASGLGGRVKEIFERIEFHSLPLAAGRLQLDWEEKWDFDLQMDMNWSEFDYGGKRIKSLQIALATDGKRVIIPQAQLKTMNGECELKLFYHLDSELSLEARMESTVDPTLFHGLLGEGADRFLESCRMDGEQGPEIKADVQAVGFSLKDWKVEGKIDSGPFTYKEVSFLGARSPFCFEGGILHVSDLIVERQEGKAQGGISFDFAREIASFKKLMTHLHVQEVAPVLGGKFPEYVAPYRFDQAPQLWLEGRVDLREDQEDSETNLMVKIEAPGTMEWKLFGIDFLFGRPKAQLTFQRRHMAVQMKSSQLFDGTISGRLSLDLSEKNPPYQTQILIKDADFKQLMEQCFHHTKSSGILNTEAQFSGKLHRLELMEGKGLMSIRDGYLTSIPFLGGLSELTSALIPNLGYAEASNATAEFQISDGFVSTENLDIFSTNFALIGKGNYHFLQDHLDLDMRVNIRGLPGVFLFPISKLFEYHGEGPLGEVVWEPKHF